MGFNAPFFDRDYFQDNLGDIYQVFGSIHPPEGIFALQKYHLVEAPLPDHFYWVQKFTQKIFERMIPNYSAESAAHNIAQSSYQQFSSIFQTNMIVVPRSQIEIHWEPRARFQALMRTFISGTFNEKLQLDDIERETLDVAVLFLDTFDLHESNMGISGSLLWEGQHENSDIDLVIYGWQDTKKILDLGSTLQFDAKNLRKPRNAELLSKAEKMIPKTGLSADECFANLFHKPFLFYHKDRPVSIMFVPTLEELIHSPLYTVESQFESIGLISLQARIISDQWGYFYPGVFAIEGQTFTPISLESDIEILPNEITRLFISEYENVGYYGNNDIVEIQGLLQICRNVPDFNSPKLITTYQILVGSNEYYGQEYVRVIND